MDGMANSGAKPLTHGPRRLALRLAADAQSLLYLVALPAIVGWQWVNGLVWWLYGIALFLTDPARPVGPSGESLRDRFQLTKAEAALAVQLIDGVALAEAAGILDIAYNTARSHLRAIFAKTGTHRQVQLVTLLRSVDKEMDSLAV